MYLFDFFILSMPFVLIIGPILLMLYFYFKKKSKALNITFITTIAMNLAFLIFIVSQAYSSIANGILNEAPHSSIGDVFWAVPFIGIYAFIIILIMFSSLTYSILKNKKKNDSLV